MASTDTTTGRVIVHPGEILKEDFMEPNGLSATALAKELGVSAPTVNDVVRGQRGITASLALKLQERFGPSAEMWMGLQSRYELDLARDKADVRARLPSARVMARSTQVSVRKRTAQGDTAGKTIDMMSRPHRKLRATPAKAAKRK